ncbi:tenascin-X-like [Narcine bancroftii]|uniref:tenascin-X-like n=1 Tax=Narcine bancroftii TaxID=1343680 RepID=UPI0038320D89
MMEAAFRILLLLLAVATLDVGDCSLFRTTLRQRRALLPNATHGRLTNIDHIYTISLPHCSSCVANASRSWAQVFEAQDEAIGDKKFEHVLDPTKPVVFTHRINIPPQACGCGENQALMRRLQALEKEVAALQQRCPNSGCCGSGPVPDCGPHGTYSSSSCRCLCHDGWGGPTCSEALCPQACKPPRGKCVNGSCTCHQGFTGADCSQEICPDDCNDQGRCIAGRCVCFPGYTGRGCTVQTCPGNCRRHGKCIGGVCACDPGYSGYDCGIRDCLRGKCLCKDGSTNAECSTEIPVALRLRMKKILETQATVEWQLPKDKVDGWVISFRPLKEDERTLTHRLAGSRSSFQQTGLASGQEYEVTLQAQKDKKLGMAVTRTFTTMIDSPQNLHVVSATDTTIELGWQKPLAVIDRYRLNYSSATGRRSQTEVPPGDSQAVLTGLEAGVEHTISLVGERGDHRSKAVATRGTTGEFPLTVSTDCPGYTEAPGILGIVPLETRRAACLPQTSRDLQGMVCAGMMRTGLETRRAAYLPQTCRALRGLVASRFISPGGPRLTVLSVQQAGSSSRRSCQSLPLRAIDSPRSLRVMAVTDSTITLQWESSVADVSLYRIKYSSKSSRSGELEVSGKDQTATLERLEKGTRYTITLVAEEGKMKSEPVITTATTGKVQLGTNPVQTIGSPSTRSEPPDTNRKPSAPGALLCPCSDSCYPFGQSRAGLQLSAARSSPLTAVASRPAASTFFNSRAPRRSAAMPLLNTGAATLGPDPHGCSILNYRCSSTYDGSTYKVPMVQKRQVFSRISICSCTSNRRLWRAFFVITSLCNHGVQLNPSRGVRVIIELYMYNLMQQHLSRPRRTHKMQGKGDPSDLLGRFDVPLYNVRSYGLDLPCHAVTQPDRTRSLLRLKEAFLELRPGDERDEVEKCRDVGGKRKSQGEASEWVLFAQLLSVSVKPFEHFPRQRKVSSGSFMRLPAAGLALLCVAPPEQCGSCTATAAETTQPEIGRDRRICLKGFLVTCQSFELLVGFRTLLECQALQRHSSGTFIFPLLWPNFEPVATLVKLLSQCEEGRSKGESQRLQVCAKKEDAGIGNGKLNAGGQKVGSTLLPRLRPGFESHALYSHRVGFSSGFAGFLPPFNMCQGFLEAMREGEDRPLCVYIYGLASLDKVDLFELKVVEWVLTQSGSYHIFLAMRRTGFVEVLTRFEPELCVRMATFGIIGEFMRIGSEPHRGNRGKFPFDKPLRNQHNLKLSVIVQRFTFRRLFRKPGRSVAKFGSIEILRQCWTICSVVDCYAALIMVRIQCRLLGETPSLTFQEALEISQGIEVAANNVKDIQKGHRGGGHSQQQCTKSGGRLIHGQIAVRGKDIDSGATASVISEETYRRTRGPNLPPIRPSKLKLRTYTGRTVPHLGLLYVDISAEGQKVEARLVIAKGTQVFPCSWLVVYHHRAATIVPVLKADKMGKLFTKLDMSHAYQQLLLDKDSKETKRQWSEEQDEAFKDMKELLHFAKLLVHSDPDKNTTLSMCFFSRPLGILGYAALMFLFIGKIPLPRAPDPVAPSPLHFYRNDSPIASQLLCPTPDGGQYGKQRTCDIGEGSKSVAHRELAGSHSSRALAANGSQSIQDISRAISKRISATAVSTNAGVMARSAVRRYSALARRPLSSPRVLLSSWPLKPKHPPQKGDGAKVEGNQIPATKAQEGPLVGNGRPESPARKVIGPPGSNTMSRGRKDHDGSPGLPTASRGRNKDRRTQGMIPTSSRKAGHDGTAPRIPLPHGSSPGSGPTSGAKYEPTGSPGLIPFPRRRDDLGKSPKTSRIPTWKSERGGPPRTPTRSGGKAQHGAPPGIIPPSSGKRELARSPWPVPGLKGKDKGGISPASKGMQKASHGVQQGSETPPQSERWEATPQEIPGDPFPSVIIQFHLESANYLFPPPPIPHLHTDRPYHEKSVRKEKGLPIARGAFGGPRLKEQRKQIQSGLPNRAASLEVNYPLLWEICWVPVNAMLLQCQRPRLKSGVVGRQNPEFQVPSSEFLHPPLLHQRSSKPAGVVVWNATSSHAELSWEITGSSFDSLVLGYRDSLTKVAEAEVTLRGTQRAANITGLIVGQSYDLYLYGISLDRPSQPVNVTKITDSHLRFIRTALRYTVCITKRVVMLEQVSQRSLYATDVSSLTSSSKKETGICVEGWGKGEELGGGGVQTYRQKVLIGYDQRTVRGLDIGSTVTKEESMDVQTMPAGAGEEGSEEEEEEEEEVEEEDEDEEGPEVEAQWEKLSSPSITHENLTPSWIPAPFKDPLVESQGFSTSRPYETLVPTDPLSPEQTTPTPDVDQNVTFQVTTDDTLSIPPTASSDRAATLGNVSAEEVTARSLRLSWTVRGGIFNSFLVRYREASGSTRWQEHKVLGHLRSLLLKGLRPGTKYSFLLHGVQRGQRSEPLSLLATTDPLEKTKTAAKLDTFVVSNITDSSFLLAWSTVRRFDSFLIHYRAAGSKDVQKVRVAGDLRSFVITGLKPGTKYTLYLFGISSNQRTKPISSTATTGKARMRLGRLSVLNVTSNSIRLSWTADRTFDSYMIQYRVRGSQETRNVTVAGGKRGYLIVGLRPSTRYTVYLYGTSGSVRTQPLTAHVTTTAASVVAQTGMTNLVVSNVTSNSLQLSWESAWDYDTFLVEYQAAGQEAQSTTVTGNLRSKLLSSLQPATAYTIDLYGLSAGTRSKPLTTVATTEKDQVQPSEAIKPDTLSLSNITTGSFRISWKMKKVFDSFFILYGVQGSEVMRNLSVTGDRRFVVIKDLSPGTAYTIRVYGVSPREHSKPLTAVVTTKVKGKVKPKKLWSLSVSRVSTDSIRLVWKAERGFDAFLVRYKEHISGVTQNVTTDGGRRALTLMDLQPGTKYTVYVHGLVNGQRTRPLSRVIAIPATTGKGPVRLGGVSAANTTATSTHLSWTVDRTFDSYLIQYRVQGTQEIQNITVAGGKRGYLIVGLRPSTRYTIYLYGIFGLVRTQPLTTHITTTASEDKDSATPERLGSLSPPIITANSIRLSWTPNRTFDSYVIQYRVHGMQETQNVTVAGGKRGYLIVGLRPSTRYTIYLYGITGSVRTQPLTTHATTTATEDKVPVTPERLGSLSPPIVTANSIRLSWTPDRTFDSYLIQFRVHGTQETQNVTVAGGKRGYLIVGLQPSTRYTIYLYGITGSVSTQPLTTHATTTASEDKVPATAERLGSLSPPIVTANSIRLSWTPDRTFDSYLIQYREQGTQETRNVTVAGGKRGYLIMRLRPSTRYTVYVYGIKGSVHSQPLTAHVTTTASEDKVSTAPVSLGKLSPPNVTPTSIRLSWTPYRTFNSYLIQYRVRGSQETRNITVAGGKRGYLIGGLRPSTRYTVYLYGISGSVRTQPLTAHITTPASEDKVPATPVRLGRLLAPNVTANSVHLSWTPDRTFDSYLIQYRVHGTQETQNITVAGGKRGYLIVGLQPSTRYTIYLYGITGSVSTQPLTTHATTTASEEKVPATAERLGSLSPPIVTANSIRLTWTPDRTFDSYLIQYREQGTQETRNVTVAGGKRGYLIMRLRPSTRYTVYVYGIKGSVHSQPLTAHVTTTASEDKVSTAPVRLGKLSPPKVTPTSIRLSWTPYRTFNSYLIQYRVLGSQETRNVTVAGGKRGYIIGGLRPSTRYTVYLYGISGSVRTQPLTAHITTPASEDKVPAAPVRLGRLLAPNVTANSIHLSWTPDRTFDSYVIQYRVHGTQETQNITVAGGKRGYHIMELQPSTRYTIYLYGITGSVSTQPLTIHATTTASEDKVPATAERLGSLSPPIVTANSIRLSWTPDRTFDSYLIQYRVQGTQETRNVTVAGGKRGYHIMRLRPSTRYTIYVYGIKGSVHSQPLTAHVTTTASEDKVSTAPVSLGKLSPPNVTPTSIRLSWTPYRTFNSYLIQYRVLGSQETRNITVAGGKRGYLIGGLRPSTRYTVYLYGISGSVRTQPLTAHITTPASEDKVPAAPVRLGSLLAPNVTANSVHLSWTPDRTFDSYLIQYRVRGSQEIQNITVAGEKRGYLIMGLRPSTRYTVYLYGISGSVRTLPLTTHITTTASEGKVPDAPVRLDRLSAPKVTANSVHLSWTPDRTFDSYLIQYRVRGSQKTRNVTVAGGKRGYLIVGLQPSTRYTIYLYGISGSVRTQPLTTHITTTASEEKVRETPVRLGRLSAPSVTSNSIRLSWTVDRTFDSYLIQYKVHGTQEIRNVTVAGGKRGYLIVGLRPSTKYTIYLYGISGSVRTQPLTTHITTTASEDKVPVVPVSLSPPNITANSIRLSWTPHRTYESYLIQYRVQGMQEIRNVTVAGSKRGYLIVGLQPSTKYIIYLYGISGSVRTQPLTSQITTTASQEKVPETPVRLGRLSAPSITANSIRLSWTADRTFDSYLIQYRVRGSQETQNVTVAGGKRGYLIVGLRPSTRYTIYLYGILGSVRTQPLTTHITTTADHTESLVMLLALMLLVNRNSCIKLNPPHSPGDASGYGCDVRKGSIVVDDSADDGQSHRQTCRWRLNCATDLGYQRLVLSKWAFGIHQFLVGLWPNMGGNNKDSLPSAVKEDRKPMAVPSLDGVSVSRVTGHSLELSWTAGGTFDSFLIQYGVKGSADVSNLTVTGEQRSTAIRGLRPRVAYTLRVHGLSDSQLSRPLGTVTHTTVLPQPLKPHSLQSNPSASELQIQTSDTIRKPSAPDDPQEPFLPSASSHIRLPGLLASSYQQSATCVFFSSGAARWSAAVVTILLCHLFCFSYTYDGVFSPFVSALCQSAVSLESETLRGYRCRYHGPRLHTSTGDRVTKPSESAELGALSALVLSPSSVRLSWPARRDFDSFIVQYWPQGSEVMRKVTVKGSSQSYTIAGLSPNSKYTFHLYGVSGGRRSAPSSATVSTKDVPESASPTRPGVSNIKDDSFQISWTVERVFQFFLIQYRAHSSYGFQNLTVPSDRRSYYIAGLRPSTRYIIYLYGVHRMQLTKLMALIATTAASRVKEGPRPAHPQALGALSVSNITADSLELSWTGGGRFDSYIIQYRAQDSERVQKIRLAGSRHSYVILGLRPTTKYVIYIRGVSRGRQTEPLSIAISTTASVDTNGVRPSRLNKLIRLSGNNVTENSLQVSWAAESGFDSFLIQYRAEGSTETQNITAAADQQSALISGLRPATAYQVSLYGLSDNRRTKPLTTVVTTAASVEQVTSSMFGSLSFSNITANSFKLSWEADNAFESFLIEYIAQGTDTRYNLTVPGNRRSAFVTGIKPATNYTIYLYGVSEGRLSRPLAAHLTIKAIPVHSTSFSTLGGLSVSDISSHGLRLSWTVEQGQFDLFLVRYWDSRGRLASKEVIVPGNRRDISISDLIPSTEYQLSLSGIVDGRQTDPIPITAQIAGVSQRELRFTDINDTSVTISWAAGSDPVDTYKIFYVPMKRGEPRSRSVNGRRTNITLSSLVPGTQYEVNLVPVRGQRERPPIVGGFTTAPDSPSHLKAINISETKALLVWRPATAPIDHYVISYKAEGVPAVNKTVSSDSVQQQLEGLHANTAYTAVIYSVQGGRRSSDLTISFTTGSEQLNGLLVSDISSTEALVSWDGQRAGVTGYLLLYGIKGDKAQQVTTGSRVTSHRLRKLHPVSRYTVRLHGLRDGERLAPSTAHFTTAAREHIPFPKDCAEELTNGRTESGVVTLYLKGNKEKPIRVLCDMATDGGGWIVFQRRINGKVNFMRPWKDYVTGFGAVSAEHWLGLENLHQLTSQERYELRVDLRAGQESAYATYDNFVVEDVAMNYQLGLGKYAGTAGNSLSYHRGSNFTTIDMDNDEALTNCAISYRGGWWYRNCHRVNLNGEYGNNKDHQGVNWYGWKGFEFSIPSVEMKMRPLQSHTESRKP